MRRSSKQHSLTGISTNVALLIAAYTVLSGYLKGLPVGTLLIKGVIVFAVAQIVLELGHLVIVWIQLSLRRREATRRREEALKDK